MTSYRNDDEDAEIIIELIKIERDIKRKRERKKKCVWLSVFEKQNMQRFFHKWKLQREV